MQYNTIQYNTIQYNTIQYNTMQYNTIQYNTMRCNGNSVSPTSALGIRAVRWNNKYEKSVSMNGIVWNSSTSALVWFICYSRLSYHRTVQSVLYVLNSSASYDVTALWQTLELRRASPRPAIEWDSDTMCCAIPDHKCEASSKGSLVSLWNKPTACLSLAHSLTCSSLTCQAGPGRRPVRQAPMSSVSVIEIQPTTSVARYHGDTMMWTMKE